MWILRQIISFLRFAWPHLLKAAIVGLWFAIQLCFFAVVTTFQRMKTLDTTVEEWVKEAKEHGFPWMWERYLRFFFWVIAISAVLAGWAMILFTLGFAAWYGGDYVVYLLTTP
jgi:hypothetical protein